MLGNLGGKRNDKETEKEIEKKEPVTLVFQTLPSLLASGGRHLHIRPIGNRGRRVLIIRDYCDLLTVVYASVEQLLGALAARSRRYESHLEIN